MPERNASVKWKLLGGIATAILCASVAGAQPAAGPQARSINGIELVPVRGNVYLMAGDGANISLSVGQQGVLLVDSGVAGQGNLVRDQALTLNRSVALAGKPDIHGEPPLPPISFLLNTSARPDHVGGNSEVVGKGGVGIYAYDGVLSRMTSNKMPQSAFPTITFDGPSLKLSRWFNGEGIELFRMPAAISDGDSVVHFRGSDVISTGDIIDLRHYPGIDTAEGGTIDGEVDALNRVLDMMIPDDRVQGGTLVIPGHGRICDSSDVAFYRNMVIIVRDRVAAMKKKGMTLEQVQNSKPTEDWDPQYGKDAVWTPARFVEAVYKTSAAKDVKQ
jgi:cyclase